MTYDEGEGIAFADLELSSVPPTDLFPETFWIEQLPSTAAKAWEKLASFGQNYYGTVVKPTLVHSFPHLER